MNLTNGIVFKIRTFLIKSSIILLSFSITQKALADEICFIVDTYTSWYGQGFYSCEGIIYQGSFATSCTVPPVWIDKTTNPIASIKGGSCKCEVELDWLEDTKSGTKEVCYHEPIADFVVSQNSNSGTGTNQVFFNSISYDPDGGIVDYFWTINGSTDLYTEFKNGETIKYAQRGERTVEVTLEVTDNHGFSNSVTKHVDIESWNCTGSCIIY